MGERNPSGEQSLDTLIALYSNMEAVKENRAAIKADREAAEQAIANLRETQDQIERDKAANAAAIAEAKELRDQAVSYTAEAKAQQAKNEEWLGLIEARETAVTRRENDHKEVLTRTGERENDILHREMAVDAREKGLADRAAAVEKAEADYAAKLKAHTALVTGEA